MQHERPPPKARWSFSFVDNHLNWRIARSWPGTRGVGVTPPHVALLWTSAVRCVTLATSLTDSRRAKMDRAQSTSFSLSDRATRTADQPIGFLISTALANPGIISLAAGLV